MKNILASIVLIAAVSMLFTSCKKDVQMQVALSGDWKMSSECTGDIDRTTGTAQIFPGSGDKEVIITNVINAMTIYYRRTGEAPVRTYTLNGSSRDLPVSTDGKDITVNYSYTDPNFDAAHDSPESNMSYTVTGNGSISDDEERITLSLTLTFAAYDPFLASGGTDAATPKPLSNTCQYTLTKVDVE